MHVTPPSAVDHNGAGPGDAAIGTRCPLLLAHLETRNPRRRIAVADAALGSPRSLAAYSALRGRFAFLGIADVLGGAEPDVVAALGEALQRYAAPAQDLLLLWDLPNYVAEQRLAALGELTRRWLRPGGRLHMLVASSQRRVAARPGRFEILPGWAGVVAVLGDPVREAPRFNAWQVERAFAGFEIERSVLLRSGMQEYLLRLKMSTAGSAEAP